MTGRAEGNPDTGAHTPISAAQATARPLCGEPLALDLVNTRWIDGHGRQDLLAGVAGLAAWLTEIGMDATCAADPATLAATREARAALEVALAEPADVTDLNRVLDHGRLRRQVVGGVPVDEADIDPPAWRLAWLAATDYTELLAKGAGRIRACSNDACILYFFDTSKGGTRRWCSMAGCGNRAKAARHYDRARTT